MLFQRRGWGIHVVSAEPNGPRAGITSHEKAAGTQEHQGSHHGLMTSRGYTARISAPAGTRAGPGATAATAIPANARPRTQARIDRPESP